MLVTGARGTLGSALERACRARGLACHAITRTDLDIADPDSVRRVFEEVRPWAVIKRRRLRPGGRCRSRRGTMPKRECQRRRASGRGRGRARGQAPHLLVDLVFNGDAVRPYVESDSVAPLNAYGRSKADAERAVLQSGADVLVVRTAAFFGPWIITPSSPRRSPRCVAANGSCCPSIRWCRPLTSRISGRRLAPFAYRR